MDNSWRPRPPSKICPTCSSIHFPFCPPPPFPQYFPHQTLHTNQFHHFPPQPPLPPPPYDPYPPPPPPQLIPPNDARRNYDFLPISNFVDNKRMRFHDSVSVVVADDDDDQRRLRLIRDHGAPVSSSIASSNILNNCNNTLLESNSYRFFPNDNNESLKRKFEETPPIGYHHNNVEFRGLVDSSANRNSFERSGGNRVYENTLFQGERRDFTVQQQNVNAAFQISQQHVLEPNSPVFNLSKPNMNVGPRGVFNGQPPLPNSPPPPPPPPPMEKHGFRFAGRVDSALPYSVVSQVNTSVSLNYSSKPYTSSKSYNTEIQAVKTSSNSPLGGTEGFLMRPPSHPSADKPKVIDASLILKHPHRSSRPDHVVVILRGLPGSGKSYLAKFLRDLEVENGGKAPRIHSMDDYFMTEVEKVEKSESSGSARGKKPVTKKVMEYCYEPDMEEAYRSSMLKAFKKTLDEGVFSFVIVDDRNLRVADFAQFWATAKRSGYEVYVLEATYKDPAGCAARNVHGFALTDIQKMANQWEEAPSLYMKLDIKSVLHGDGQEENGIEEVDMDTEDDQIGGISGSEDANFDKVTRPSQGDDGVLNGENKWNAVEEHPVEAVKELGKSKWSTDLDEDSIQKMEVITRKSSGLSGLIKSHGKKGKPVRWADQVGKIGFSIGAGKATNVSLVIGPGSGYNLRSNPLPDEEKLAQRSGEPRRRNIFQEQLRAEHESFKAVFEKRKQRISGLHLDDE